MIKFGKIQSLAIALLLGITFASGTVQAQPGTVKTRTGATIDGITGVTNGRTGAAIDAVATGIVTETTAARFSFGRRR